MIRQFASVPASRPQQLTSLRRVPSHYSPSLAQGSCPWEHHSLRNEAVAGILIAVLAATPLAPAHAAIPLSAADPQLQQRQALAELGVAMRTPSTSAEESVRAQIDCVMSLMSAGNAAAAGGDYDTALSSYTEIVRRYPELALAERARVTRALLLYQVGQAEDALLQLEDEEVSLRGSAEVHAAMAAMLHTERPQQVGRAEQQWAIATAFDKRFGDPEWVKTERRWPPRLVRALQRFLTLT